MQHDNDTKADDKADDGAKPRFRPVPWTALETPADAELWIAEHDLALQEHIGKNETGYGVRFTLAAGGDIYMQTSDDAIVLDVTPDAEWVAPLIAAVAQAEPPKGSMWVLPDDKLVQLILGLSTLVDSTTLVAGHNFGRRRAW
ncbi:hypothetical protein [Pseudoduganella lutea]|uniref:Uncharacterized protein n=1 Tax=Pseudoduganella lutea TaxID=321985 RepID=A0A4P6L2I1_9BURK|nr:hypothetical protein [Pseudoduganella lutea]QBE65627.1 hypothetical protein EWM63_23755 [Pseudoduganella lutea]